MVCRCCCGVCLGNLACLVGRPCTAHLYARGHPVGLSTCDAGGGGALHRYGDHPTWRRETMRGRTRVAVCLLAFLLVGTLDGTGLAQDAVEEKRPRLEFGLAGWVMTQGETKWAHDASSIPGLGNPTSKLTYKDVGTNIIEGTVRLWITP